MTGVHSVLRCLFILFSTLVLIDLISWPHSLSNSLLHSAASDSSFGSSIVVSAAPSASRSSSTGVGAEGARGTPRQYTSKRAPKAPKDAGNFADMLKPLMDAVDKNNKNTAEDPRCPSMKCGANQELIQRSTYTPAPNGCGAYGLHVDSPWHNQCCNAHDLCYVGCHKTRKICDLEFRDCMSKQCEAVKDAAKKQSCSEQVETFYSGVSIFGCQAFQDSQKEACVCKDRRHSEL